jgi:hypothetical protein
MKPITRFFRCSMLGFAILICGSLAAQNENPIKLGLKISPNLAWFRPTTTGYDNGKASAGATIGLVSEFYFSERYAFTTGLNFLFLNGNLKYQERIAVNSDSLTGTMNQKIGIIYIEVPLMLKMSTKEFGNFSFYGQAGFAAGFNLSSTSRESFESQGNTYDSKKDYSGSTTLMRGSVNIGIGTEYHVDASSRIFVGITYSNSLNNVLKGENNMTRSDVKAWLNYLELNLGFLF